MEPAQSGRSGYLQMHVQNTLSKKAPLIQTGKLGRGLSETGALGGMEAYVAHLERQLSKSGAALEGGVAERLGAIEAGLKHMEEKMAQCFELLQGTQDFCEELARDTHARFEHAQSRTQRCERALKTVYHDMPRFDKLEALTQKLVVKESREIDRQLVQLVDSRCKQLQETFLMKNNGAREFGSRSEEEGSLRLRGSGRLNGSLENEKSGEGVFKRKEGGLGSGERGLREASKDRRVDRKAKSFPGMAELASEGQLEDQLAEVAVDELQEQVDCQTEWCEQTHRRGKNECCGHHGCQQNGRKELEAREFEERIRETVEAALAGRLAASVPAETATREVESGRAASEEPSVREANSKGRERDVQGTETVSGGRNEGAAANRDGGTVERAKVPEEGAEDTRFDELVGAVAALRRDVAEVQSLRVSMTAQAAETDRLSRQLYEQAASLAGLSGGIQRLTSLETSVEIIDGGIQRLSSLETSVENLGASIQRLSSLEDAIGRTTDRIEQVATCNETGALFAEQKKIAATLREHAGAVARLQARVDDVSTLLLGGTRGGHPDVRRSAPLPSGLLAGPEVDEKRVVERVGANSTVGQTVSDLDRLQELKSSATMEVKTSLLGEVQAGKAEAAAGAVGFGQPAASSAERSRASWLSAEESSRPSGLQRGPQALLVLESPRRGVRTSGTGHVRFSEPCELLKESLDANGGTSRNPKAPSETASDVSFVESFWADSAQANSPPVPGRSSEVGSSKDTSLASIMHKFDAGSFGGSPRAEQGERLLTEKRLQSDAIKRHVDAIGDGWGFAGKDEGSAYARALAKTEERKRRLDKLYRKLASTPISCS